MIRVLGLALYGDMAASHRYRLAQYRAVLAQQGIDLQVASLLGNSYLRRLYQGQRTSITDVARMYRQRLQDVRDANTFDVWMIHCELLPFVPAFIEQRLITRPYIYDFDDAFYLKYRTGKYRFLQGLLGRKFETTMANAAAVTAGNASLAEYAQRFNPKVHRLPTVVDTARYQIAKRVKSGHAKLTIGWIGSPSTAAYLAELVEPLNTLGREFPIRFAVVGATMPCALEGVEVCEIPWSEDSEVEEIQSFDIGVMPLPDNEWARGKCAFKLIQYMACGIPVVASAVGANMDVVHPDTGFLASSTSQWIDGLRKLLASQTLREQQGLRGRQLIEAEYSLHSAAPQLASVVRSIADTPRG